jgi:hypothetical protein
MIETKSFEAININLSKTAFITRDKKTYKVDRVPSIHERKATEIGKRPPYAYTYVCCDERYRRRQNDKRNI